MTESGKNDIRALKAHLPPADEIPTVMIGCGRRFWEMAEELGLTPNRHSVLLGAADAITKDGKYIVMSYGELIPMKEYTTRADLGNSLFRLIPELKHNSLLCTGRPFMKMAGVDDAKEGSLYRFDLKFDPKRGGEWDSWSIYLINHDGTKDLAKEWYDDFPC
ncbi:MAG: hypothetical protein Q8P32_00030 [Candidatus Komeilibacteria bacterium]|nr:hypothetical protein [Candidatus Komeilibacteria bacterium]